MRQWDGQRLIKNTWLYSREDQQTRGDSRLVTEVPVFLHFFSTWLCFYLCCCKATRYFVILTVYRIVFFTFLFVLYCSGFLEERYFLCHKGTLTPFLLLRLSGLVVDRLALVLVIIIKNTYIHIQWIDQSLAGAGGFYYYYILYIYCFIYLSKLDTSRPRWGSGISLAVHLFTWIYICMIYLCGAARVFHVFGKKCTLINL